MLAQLLLVAALGSDPVASAIEQYARVESYRSTVRSGHGDGSRDILYYYFQRPGYVRMEFVRPHHGAVVVYDPRVREATIWPFGIGSFPKLSLSPDNPLLRSPGGHTVDRSDAGALLDSVRRLQQMGTTRTLGEEAVGRRRALHVVVEGTAQRTVAGVHRYDLWLELERLFPVRAESRDLRGELIESLLMDDVELDVEFPSGFFAP